jgi:hypothetical protein
MPFFECAANGSSKVEKASAVHHRHKEDCYHVRLPNAPNFHNTRRYGLSEDKIYKIRSKENLLVCNLGVT